MIRPALAHALILAWISTAQNLPNIMRFSGGSTPQNGLSDAEVEALTRSIAASAAPLHIPPELGPFADVPSTGGPASLSTLLCPLLIAAMGIRVPKVSVTGSVAGGIDSMALIAGFRTELARDEFVRALRKASFAHVQPAADFCPADSLLVQERRCRNLMDNRYLATASLLAKKLAVATTHACFDFRVGAAGNIGRDIATSAEAAMLFHRIAHRLNIRIAVVLTDNSDFPCSALGRLESLHLLWQIISGDTCDLPALDREHVDTCVALAACACSLVNPDVPFTVWRARMYDAIESRAVLKVFREHLVAQGASPEGLGELLAVRDRQVCTTVFAPDTGFWIAPPLDFAKKWFKRSQELAMADLINLHSAADLHIGCRLLVSPGNYVKKGDPVIEVRTARQAPAFEMEID